MPTVIREAVEQVLMGMSVSENEASNKLDELREQKLVSKLMTLESLKSHWRKKRSPQMYYSFFYPRNNYQAALLHITKSYRLQAGKKVS